MGGLKGERKEEVRGWLGKGRKEEWINGRTFF